VESSSTWINIRSDGDERPHSAVNIDPPKKEQSTFTNISSHRKQGGNQNEITRIRRNEEEEEKGTEKWPLDFDGHRDFFPSPDRWWSPAPWFACIQIGERGQFLLDFGLGFRVFGFGVFGFRERESERASERFTRGYLLMRLREALI